MSIDKRNFHGNVLSKIPNQPQRQDSTVDQLNDLLSVAVKLGMYDAYDVVKILVK